MPIRSLCVTESADRHTTATFIGMHEAGIDMTVVCRSDHPNQKVLSDTGVPIIDNRLPKNSGRAGIVSLLFAGPDSMTKPGQFLRADILPMGP